MLKADHPDAVLLDVQMPGMDGFEVCRRIREAPGLAGLPVIAMTANATREDRDRCLAAGMNDFVVKPIDPDGLLRTVAAWLPERAENDRVDAGIPSPSGVPLALPPSLPGIDLQDGVRRLMGNAPFYVEMLLQFQAEYGSWPETIRDSWRAGRREEAWRAAHALKGAAANVAAFRVREAAAALEVSLKAGGEGDPEALFDEVDMAMCECRGSCLTLQKHLG
jgi:two-component system sensor histidine kinase/response regulator